MKILHKGFKILCAFLVAFLLLISIIILIYIFQIGILKKEYGNIFGYTVFYVQTGSMIPTIQIGDGILVKCTKNISDGDIVVYKDEGKNIICHRLIKIENEKLILKGDANNAEDEPIESKQVIGKVIKVITKFKFIQETIRNSYILILIILILISIIKNKIRIHKLITW